MNNQIKEAIELLCIRAKEFGYLEDQGSRRESDESQELYNEALTALTKIIDDNEANYRHAAELCQRAFDDMFAHCLSNGVYNRWGNPMSCMSINEAKQAVDVYLREPK